MWRNFVLLVAAASSLVRPCSADHLLVFKWTSEKLDLNSEIVSVRDGHNRVWLGESVARLDVGDKSSYIVDLRENHLTVLNRLHHEYQVFKMPVNMMEQIKGESTFALEELETRSRPIVSIRDYGQSAPIDEWNVEFYHWSIGTRSRHQYELKAWITQGLEIDESLYKTLVSNYLGVGFSRRWRATMLEPDGIAVKVEGIADDGRHRRKTTVLLESITEQEHSRDRYRAPEDYSLREFDASKYLTIDRFD